MAEYIEIPLYNEDVMIKFYQLSHQYWVSVKGDKFTRRTGVTTICGIKDKSIALGMWQQQITADFLLKKIAAGESITHDLALEAIVQNDLKLKESVDIGNEIHDWCSKYIKFKLKEPGYREMPSMPELKEAVTGVNAFLDWEKENKVKFLSSERVVYSKKHDFIGTMDIEAMVNGKIALTDLKSGNGLYNSVRAQTAAYVMADMEEDKKKKYQVRWAIRVAKLTEEEYFRKEERKKEIKQFIARFQGKEVKDYPIKEYVAFEAKCLDLDENLIERDFKAFLAHKEVYKWDALTNPYYIGANW